MEKYLSPTYYIESDHPAVIEFADKHTQSGEKEIKRAIQLYYAVRDGI